MAQILVSFGDQYIASGILESLRRLKLPVVAYPDRPETVSVTVPDVLAETLSLKLLKFPGVSVEVRPLG